MNYDAAKDLMLASETAKRLYFAVRELPIYDYHCHLSPEEIYLDRRFFDLGELWLEADHYKWRIMRQFGVDERYVTGDASFEEKFMKFAEALPHFVGSPVYHWVKMELALYFGIEEPLSPATAKEIWQKTKGMMADFSARKLIKASNVRAVVTTDDPLSDLEYHKALEGEEFQMLPCFRFDRALNVGTADTAEFLRALEKKTGVKIEDVKSLIFALAKRLDFFVQTGCVAADVSFDDFPSSVGDLAAADACVKKAISGTEATPYEREEFRFFLLKEMARLLDERDLVMQMHVGVMRNVNTRRFGEVGADCGIDSLSNPADVKKAAKLLDAIAREGLPKTIIYTLNPSAYYPLASLLGDFAGRTKGRVQLGAAWWFMDSRDGILEQLKIFANTLGIGLFNGMLTDSRSFTSYARHDYFRRILCSLLADWVNAGECSYDLALATARNICYDNAKNYFGGIK